MLRHNKVKVGRPFFNDGKLELFIVHVEVIPLVLRTWSKFVREFKALIFTESDVIFLDSL